MLMVNHSSGSLFKEEKNKLRISLSEIPRALKTQHFIIIIWQQNLT
jgi:hypothetical protein